MLNINHFTLKKATHYLINDLSLTIQKGEIFTLMGPSGCGKSTLLNWIIGFQQPAFHITGSITLNQKIITNIPIQERKIGILFQDDWLFPHMTVGQNLAFALPANIKGKWLRQKKVEQTLASAQLPHFQARMPNTLSGGQRARISLLRSLLAEPNALLLDEPFSKLDPSLHIHFRQFIYSHIQARNIPTLLVTHNKHDVPKGGNVIQL